MDSVLVHTGEEPVVLTAKAAGKLLERGNGDAALLYLALLRRRGSTLPRSLAGELRWEKDRIEAAEQALRELELIATPEVPREPEKPEYQQTDIAMRLEDNPEFRELVRQTEHLLGRKLTTPNLKILLGLYDYLGLPAHIVYQLVNHCMERTAAQYGPGRRPTMRAIENEGYAWARLNLYSQEAVDRYLKRDAERRSALAPYMRLLGLGDRAPVPSEEKYLSAWLDAGFPVETVAIAYDKTVLHCHEFQWGYCNGILRRWDAEGLHTPEEVNAADKPRNGQGVPSGKRGGVQRRPVPSEDELQKSLRELHRG